MGINDLYSKRKKLAERGNQPDVYQYTDLPVEFRRQVIHIWISAIGPYREPQPFIGTVPLVSCLWKTIHDLIARELGRFNLGSEFQNPFEQCKSFLLDKDTLVDHLLDLIEVTFCQIDKVIPQILQDYQYSGELNVSQLSEDAISELNHRFREHE